MMRRRGWAMLVIPAIAPEDAAYRIGPGEDDVHQRRAGEVLLPDREPLEVLERLRADLGSSNFAAQYGQDPIPPGGNIIHDDWLRYFDEEPADLEHLVASWDLASTVTETSSWSVGQLWGAVGAHAYLLDLVRVRLEAPELRRLILQYTKAWDPHVTLVEDTELGRTLVQEIRRTTDLRPRLIRPRGEKTARLEAHAPAFEAGRVHVARSFEWFEGYRRELLAFPYGAHDDQVDATSQALNYLTQRSARGRKTMRRNITRREVIRD